MCLVYDASQDELLKEAMRKAVAQDFSNMPSYNLLDISAHCWLWIKPKNAHVGEPLSI